MFIHEAKEGKDACKQAMRCPIISPHSKRMQYWDITITLALAFTAVVTPVEISFLGTKMDGLWYINQFVNLIFCIDMIINMKPIPNFISCPKKIRFFSLIVSECDSNFEFIYNKLSIDKSYFNIMPQEQCFPRCNYLLNNIEKKKYTKIVTMVHFK